MKILKVIKIVGKKELLKVIHGHCLECCGKSEEEVQNCQSNSGKYSKCALYPYRMGKDVKE